MKKENLDQYSVLMSVYYKDNAIWLKEAIESMLEQTIKTDDFVLVEDGKLTNELEDVINYYEKKYESIFNIIRIKENGGLGPALALGVENCKNELIARMDADDYSKPTRCEKQLNKFNEDNEIDIVGTNIVEFIDTIDKVQAYRILPKEDKEIKRYARKRNPFGHPSVMFRKKKILEAGNYRSYYLCEDYDMWIRMIEKNAKCYNLQENLVYMRIGKDFYKRRGGIKYLKSIIKFKIEQYNNGFYSLKDFIITSCASIIVCLAPNFIRDKFYKKILRNKGK